MKILIILTYSMLILWMVFPLKYSFAQNIQTGNTSSMIETNITGNGNVKTHIETTVNGQTNVIDSNQPGSIEVKNENGKVTVSKSPDITITISQNKTSTLSPTLIPKQERKNFMFYFFEKISNFLKRIYYNL